MAAELARQLWICEQWISIYETVKRRLAAIDDARERVATFAWYAECYGIPVQSRHEILWMMLDEIQPVRDIGHSCVKHTGGRTFRNY